MRDLKLNNLILIGASTGGPSHIKKILKALPLDCKSTIVIAQHMADPFIETFIKHMNTISSLKVRLAKNNGILEPSTVYITTKLSQIKYHAHRYSFDVSESEVSDYNPNINTLFSSCSVFSNTAEVLAIILTGIGDDGSLGMKKLSTTNANCIAESESSAVVYGMPQRAKEVSTKVKVQSLTEIIETIKGFGV